MLDANNAHTPGASHWPELTRTAPVIPDAPAASPQDINWYELGEYAWHYSVATGNHGDDEEECHLARECRQRIEAHLPHLNAQHLRDYLEGLMEGVELFMWAGL